LFERETPKTKKILDKRKYTPKFEPDSFDENEKVPQPPNKKVPSHPFTSQAPRKGKAQVQ
jgi:hypothetical protein